MLSGSGFKYAYVSTCICLLCHSLVASPVIWEVFLLILTSLPDFPEGPGGPPGPVAPCSKQRVVVVNVYSIVYIYIV